jgi:rubrerythrin
MNLTFNIDEIFEIAQKIERNGAKFYRKAIQFTDDEKIKQMLADLATMEERHEKTFALMKSRSNVHSQSSSPFDPNNEAVAYLQAFADGYIFNLSEDISEQISGKESLDEIMNTAIRLEKDSIVFYLGIEHVVSEHQERDQVGSIIREEMKHIAFLTDYLKRIKIS